jgi:hypothetical protein
MMKIIKPHITAVIRPITDIAIVSSAFSASDAETISHNYILMKYIYKY